MKMVLGRPGISLEGPFFQSESYVHPLLFFAILALLTSFGLYLFYFFRRSGKNNSRSGNSNPDPNPPIPLPTLLPFPSINPFRKTLAHISNSPLTIEGPIHPTQFKLRHFIPILECNFFYAARCIACRFESPTSFLINLLYGNFERA
jgi:hypothetical protein